MILKNILTVSLIIMLYQNTRAAIVHIINKQMNPSLTTLGVYFKHDWHIQNTIGAQTSVDSGSEPITRLFWTSYYEAPLKNNKQYVEARIKIWEIRFHAPWSSDHLITLFNDGRYQFADGTIHAATFITDVQTGQSITYNKLL